MRVFVGSWLEKIQLGLEAFHVGRQFGDLAFFLFDSRLQGRHLISSLLMSNHLVVKPDVSQSALYVRVHSTVPSASQEALNVSASGSLALAVCGPTTGWPVMRVGDTGVSLLVRQRFT